MESDNFKKKRKSEDSKFPLGMMPHECIIVPPFELSAFIFNISYRKNVGFPGRKSGLVVSKIQHASFLRWSIGVIISLSSRTIIRLRKRMIAPFDAMVWHRRQRQEEGDHMVKRIVWLFDLYRWLIDGSVLFGTSRHERTNRGMKTRCLGSWPEEVSEGRVVNYFS